MRIKNKKIVALLSGLIGTLGMVSLGHAYECKCKTTTTTIHWSPPLGDGSTTISTKSVTISASHCEKLEESYQDQDDTGILRVRTVCEHGD